MEFIGRGNPIEQKGLEFNLAMFGKSVSKFQVRGKRGRNEDAFGIDQRIGVAMVLDGMGGLGQGDRASSLSRDFLMGRLKSIVSHEPEVVKQGVRQALIDASVKLGLEVPGSGTTTTAAKFIKDLSGLRVIIGSVGDSRAYLLRDREIQQITEDDSALSDSDLSLEEKRRIQDVLDYAKNRGDLVGAEAARYWGKRNQISQYLGKAGSIQPHIYNLNLRQQDIILLTTDGIHDNLTRREIKSQMARTAFIDQTEVVNRLIHEASLRVTGEEFERDLLRRPLHQRAMERLKWKLHGRPTHLRAKADDLTAVAIKVR